MTVELIAFIDESKKPVRDRRTKKVAKDGGEFFVVAGAIVFDSDLGEVRTRLTETRSQVGAPLHYSELGRERRIEALEAIDTIEGWDGYLFETARPLPRRNYSEHHVRAKTLAEAFTYLGSTEGVLRAVLETRAHPVRGLFELDTKDHQVVQKLLTNQQIPAGFRIRHDDKSEVILQIADLIAGARSDFLCGINEDIYPRISHRIRQTRTVFDTRP